MLTQPNLVARCSIHGLISSDPSLINGQVLFQENFQPDWRDVWTGARPRKEAAFLWSVFYKAVAVNQWRHRAISAIPEVCTCCNAGIPESVVHCFYDCVMARPAWKFAASILQRLENANDPPYPRPLPSWEQCIIGTSLPPAEHKYQATWSVMLSTVIWQIWLQWNQVVFHNSHWPV